MREFEIIREGKNFYLCIHRHGDSNKHRVSVQNMKELITESERGIKIAKELWLELGLV